jgi:hypothetical protein
MLYDTCTMFRKHFPCPHILSIYPGDICHVIGDIPCIHIYLYHVIWNLYHVHGRLLLCIWLRLSCPETCSMYMCAFIMPCGTYTMSTHAFNRLWGTFTMYMDMYTMSWDTFAVSTYTLTMSWWTFTMYMKTYIMYWVFCQLLVQLMSYILRSVPCTGTLFSMFIDTFNMYEGLGIMIPLLRHRVRS